MIRKFYEADHGYDNSGSSLTSGGKSAEDVKPCAFHNQLTFSGDDGIEYCSNCGEPITKYARQYAHQQPVQPGDINKWLEERLSHKRIDDEFGWTGEYSLCQKDLIDFIIDFNQSQQPVNDGWVRVEDALPERGERVISVDENYTVECSYLNVFDEWKRSADGNILRNFPTHWRTLPEPPKQTP